MKKYDNVIVGGGTSGCACAYISALLGLKTLLIEKNNFLGGLMTAGLVVPVMKSSVDDLNCEYYKKLVKTARKFSSQITYKDKNDGWFNPQTLKIVLDDLLTSSEVNNNLEILFETEVKEVLKENGIIKSLVLESGLLSLPIEAMYFVDATGSGNFSKLCGCNFLTDYSTRQQNSLRFILGNVNIEKFKNFLDNLGDSEDITNTYRNDIDTNNELHFTTASTWDEKTDWKLDKYLKEGVKKGLLEPLDRSYFQIFSVAGSQSGEIGSVAFNCPRMDNCYNDPYMASIELIKARKAIYRLYNFVKSEFSGFENATITQIATQTGFREERRIKPRYIVTKEDLVSQKTFENPILRANYAIDVHSKEKDESVLEHINCYELPLESLMSADFENLFAIGKVMGADFMAHSALRVQKSCMSMGEGVAKAIFKEIKKINEKK